MNDEERYKDELRRWMRDGSFYADSGLEKEWLEKGQRILARSAGLSGGVVPVGPVLDEVMSTTLRRTTTETLMEALSETADRMKRGLHSPLDHILVREAATRFGEVLKG